MIGLFPVAGQNVYLITPPFFEEVKCDEPSDRKDGLSDRRWDSTLDIVNLYIQSATVNGKP